MPIAVPVISISVSSTRSPMCHLIAAEDHWDARAPGEHQHLHQYHSSRGEELDKGRCSLCLFHAVESLASVLAMHNKTPVFLFHDFPFSPSLPPYLPSPSLPTPPTSLHPLPPYILLPPSPLSPSLPPSSLPPSLAPSFPPPLPPSSPPLSLPPSWILSSGIQSPAAVHVAQEWRDSPTAWDEASLTRRSVM